jgi:proline dehydrogenase
MIFLARNEATKNFMQNRAAMSELAMRFVGGKDVLAAVETCRALKAQGRQASLFYLGEYVEDLTLIQQTVLALKAVIKHLAAANLEVHISVDPTQIGYLVNEATCRQNAFELAGEIRKAALEMPAGSRNLLMLDMEDSSVTEATLKLYEALVAASLPAALVLQAYLFRTEADLQKIIRQGGAVGWSKGPLPKGKTWLSRIARLLTTTI